MKSQKLFTTAMLFGVLMLFITTSWTQSTLASPPHSDKPIVGSRLHHIRDAIDNSPDISHDQYDQILDTNEKLDGHHDDQVHRVNDAAKTADVKRTTNDSGEIPVIEVDPKDITAIDHVNDQHLKKSHPIDQRPNYHVHYNDNVDEQAVESRRISDRDHTYRQHPNRPQSGSINGEAPTISIVTPKPAEKPTMHIFKPLQVFAPEPPTNPTDADIIIPHNDQVKPTDNEAADDIATEMNNEPVKPRIETPNEDVAESTSGKTSTDEEKEETTVEGDQVGEKGSKVEENEENEENEDGSHGNDDDNDEEPSSSSNDDSSSSSDECSCDCDSDDESQSEDDDSKGPDFDDGDDYSEGGSGSDEASDYEPPHKDGDEIDHIGGEIDAENADGNTNRHSNLSESEREWYSYVNNDEYNENNDGLNSEGEVAMARILPPSNKPTPSHILDLYENLNRDQLDKVAPS